MQLDERRAESGATQVTPQLMLSREIVPTSSAPINDNAQQVPRRESRWRSVGNWLAANPKVAFGLGIVGFFVLVAILGPVIIRQNPTAFSSDVLQPPSTAHWLGTTQTGPDVFAQVVVGARVLRAQTLSMRRREFVEAARASGETSLRIIFAEILPNEIAIVAAGLVGTVIYAILAEVGLEFLGLGDVTTVSWGTIFYWAQNNEALLLGAWWWFLAPGCCVALLGAGLAFINFGIDELANPRLRRERLAKKPAKAKKVEA